MRRHLLWATAAILALAALMFVACGPATQSSVGDQPGDPVVAQDADPTPTPEPTPTPPPFEKYPNLDETLVQIVGKFESGELTETAAAEQAPHYSGVMILVKIYATVTGVDSLDTWMGEQEMEPRFKNADVDPPVITGYVSVSQLGALSNHDGVQEVWAIPDIGESPPLRGVLGQGGPTPTPALPFWLKDGEYSKFNSRLRGLIRDYDQGLLTAQEAASRSLTLNKGESIYVNIAVETPEHGKAVVKWMKGKGISDSDINVFEPSNYRYIIAYVPVPHIKELAWRPGVQTVQTEIKTSSPDGLVEKHSTRIQQPTPTPTPTPTPVAGQGITKHGAAAWHSATPTQYRGKGVKVGIIDGGFEKFDELMGRDLPATTEVHFKCYASNAGGNPTTTVQNCLNDTNHGTRVAEAITDVAPDVELYISNAGRIDNYITRMGKIQSDVKWMIQQGVDVINYSMSWHFAVGLGDGEPAYQYTWEQGMDQHPHDIVKIATDAGVLWVNSAGNDNSYTWRGTFSDTDDDNILNYSSRDEDNYIILSSEPVDENDDDDPPGIVAAEIRWDDDYGTSKCDFDLYMYRVYRGRTALFGVSLDSQTGVQNQIPHEDVSGDRIYPGSTTSEKFYLQIKKVEHQRLPGTPDPCDDVDWVQLRVNYPHKPEHTTQDYNVRIPGTSKDPGLLAVGAAPHYQTTTIQPYSGRGPTQDGRKKPDVVGVDCAETAAHRTQYSPGTGIPQPNSKCWFWGTSQAAPHITGLAALIIQKYDSPDARKYDARDVADWIRDYATQRISSPDPNNIWGHGFAQLPATAPEASLTVSSGTVPTTMTWGASQTFTITASNVGTAGVDVRLNREGEDGSLTLTDTSSTACTWEDDFTDSRSTTQYTFTVKACASGDTNIRLYQANTNTLLAVYPIRVTSTATTSPTVTSTTQETKTVGVGSTINVGVADQFTGIVERYAAQSDDEEVAEVSMSGATLVVKGVKAGSTTVSVTASNPRGDAKKSYTVNVGSTTVTPTPTPTPTPTGNLPTVNAGADLEVDPGAWVRIVGDGRPVDEDDDAEFAWSQDPAPGGGPRVTLYKGFSPLRLYTPYIPGSDSFRFQVVSTTPRGTIFRFTLTVRDGGTQRLNTDSVKVTVN